MKVAEALAAEAKQDGSEGKRRSAISRAYYATFNPARDYAQSALGIEFKATEGSLHGKLWHELSYQPGKAARLANQGKRLLKLRKASDYDGSPAVLDAHVTESLGLARNAAELLAEVRSAREKGA